jgi:Lrp/AsnC family transcriptional regulator
MVASQPRLLREEPKSRPSGAHPSPAGPDESPAADRPLDRIDRRIILELQRDATLSLARLADRVGLSQTPCWRRVQRLEQTGVLTGRVALADPQRLGLGLTAFVSITAADHGQAWRDGFMAALKAFPEVMEVWRVAGEADYLLKVVTPDVAAFDAFYRRLSATVELRAVSSQFAMERVAYTTALPVSDAPAP